MIAKSLVMHMVALFCVFAFGAIVFAHGTGVSFEETKEGYKIDIGHDESIAALEATRFDFALYPEDLESIEGEIFSDVWVTIMQDKSLFFAGGIDKPTFGGTGFTYVFPQEGRYVISARFQKDGDTVVQSEFPLDIIAPFETTQEMPPWVLTLLLCAAGLFVGIAIGLFIPRKNKHL